MAADNVVSEYKTPEDLALMFNITAKTVREWVKTKKIKCYKFGGCYRFNQEQIDEFIEKSKVNYD